MPGLGVADPYSPRQPRETVWAGVLLREMEGLEAEEDH